MLPVEDSLDFFIDPVSRSSFFDKYWENEYLVISRDDPSYYGPLFSLEAMDGCLHVAKQSRREVVTVVPPHNSGGRAQKLRGIDLSMDGLYKAFDSGATVVVGGAEKLSVPLADLTAGLRQALGATVFVNIYMTPATSQGFEIHFDTHDVFVLQIEGSKEWHLYEKFYDFPRDMSDSRHYLRHQVRLDEEDKERFTEKARLQKGDFLYLPRGYPHKAVAGDELSLHLTVGIMPLYWMDLMKAAVEAVGAQESELRRGLPPGFLSDPNVRSSMASTFRSLAGLLEEKIGDAFDGALGAMIEKTLRGQQLPADGHFRQLADLEELGLESIVACRPGLDSEVLSAASSTVIAFSSIEVRGPAAIAPALEFIRTQRRFRIGDLPGLKDKSQLVLVKRLVREGLLSCEKAR